MTVKPIRELAEDLAGKFFESSSRSPGFRAAFPTFKAYMLGRWHQPDGSVKQYRPGWLHHIKTARTMFSFMLGPREVPQHMKDEIYEALLADREQSTRKGKNITQRMNVH